ncbi:RNA polymerase sigma factor [Micromonospora peucetia]|uniref:RNA polymerase sigma factor n=1 Tax=Micromonospora peucetia TaxID=47871 RepID=A0A1C6V0F3_9ACTN|nr:RNA polymerase sigma factor [Micromonospora peucetia]MCX4391304.1 RNA polymerase sigma factor [Micromonospora peucetia]WSA35143.1 RNA polymerase sigma factor [Micromonospora peucetia]SCL59697.1 RNA polymerase sigma-70 factor, ECF subfamily [Micromonospora peucetia]
MRKLQPDREGRFRALYADAYVDVLRFAQRRVHPSHAEDVVADAFLVAWRRAEEVPNRSDDARAWLFGIARHCLLNTQRGLGRQDALAVRIAETAPTTPTDGPEDEAVVHRLDLAAAWKHLSAGEQETLSLSVFEDLTSPQAARVLGISAASYRLRLLRARRALRRQLDRVQQPGCSPAPASRTSAVSPSTPTQMETRP